MTYCRELILRMLSLAGMTTLAISSVAGWPWGILIGVTTWTLPLPFTVSLYAVRFIPKDFRNFWTLTPPREERIPSWRSQQPRNSRCVLPR